MLQRTVIRISEIRSCVYVNFVLLVIYEKVDCLMCRHQDFILDSRKVHTCDVPNFRTNDGPSVVLFDEHNWYHAKFSITFLLSLQFSLCCIVPKILWVTLFIRILLLLQLRRFSELLSDIDQIFRRHAHCPTATSWLDRAVSHHQWTCTRGEFTSSGFPCGLILFICFVIEIEWRENLLSVLSRK